MDLHECFELLAAGDIVVPRTYIRLAEAGLLSYGRSRKDWAENLSYYRLEAPPALLCHPEVEWHPPEELHFWETPDHWYLEDLMSFAGNGCGDHWCWQRVAGKDEPQVLFCHHDMNVFSVFASSFEDFLARALAESAEHFACRQDEFPGRSDGPTVHLRACVRRMLPFLADEHREFFATLVEREPSVSEGDGCLVYRLLDKRELDAFLEPIVTKPAVGTESAYEGS